MKRILIRKAVCFLSLTLIVSIGCSSTSSPPPPKPPKAVKTVAFIPNNYSDFWKVARKGCEKADGELSDVAVVFKPPFSGKPDDQTKLVYEALNKDDADAIAISPIDSTGQKKVIDAAAKRAVVITQDSDAPDTGRLLYIGADNRAAGQQAGDLVKKALPQGGKIMVFVGKREVQNAQERFDGLKQSLAGSNVEIIDLMTDDNDTTQARDNAYQAQKKHPDIAGMVGLWSYNGPAIVQALRLEGKLGKIKIVCFDDEPDTLEAIKEGAIFGTVAQQPFEYGYQAVQLAAQILRGDRSVIPESKMIFIPTIVIQRDNVDEFREKLNNMLGGSSS